MKKTLKCLVSLAIFDLPLNEGYNKLIIRTVHENYVKKIPNWNLQGTRGKLIARYWYNYVLYHFLASSY